MAHGYSMECDMGQLVTKPPGAGRDRRIAFHIFVSKKLGRKIEDAVREIIDLLSLPLFSRFSLQDRRIRQIFKREQPRLERGRISGFGLTPEGLFIEDPSQPIKGSAANPLQIVGTIEGAITVQVESQLDHLCNGSEYLDAIHAMPTDKRESDRWRQAVKRAGRKSRLESLSFLKPWKTEGISRRTWERRRK